MTVTTCTVTQTTLNKNNYTRSGYVFLGWALEPDGEVVFEDQAEIYNLTDENQLYKNY